MKLFFYIRLSIIALLLSCSTFSIFCAVPASSVNWDIKKFLKNSPEELMKKAQNFYETSPDSAIIYYTVLGNLYSPSLSEEEKRLCLKSYLDKWELAFFNYFDYSVSFESLSRAKQIEKDLKIQEARIPLYYGCMYQTIFEQTRNNEAGEKAFKYFTEAFNQAVSGEDLQAVRMAYGNLIELAHSLGKLPSISQLTDIYKDYIERNKVDDGLYEIIMYKALNYESERNYQESIDQFKQLIEISKKLNYPRYKFVANTGLINVLLRAGKFYEALDRINKIDSQFNFDDFQDGQLMLYKLKADCYDSLGMNDKMQQYRYQYALLKDSLINYNQASAIQTSEFMDEINDLDNQLSEAHEKKTINLLIAIIMGVIALGVFVSLIMIKRKNRVLNNTNKSLYLKNLELIKYEEKIKEQREIQQNNEPGNEKYKSSSVSDSMREELWNKIIHILDHSEEVYSDDFSLDRLAVLCNSKSKYVSQVINENGNNFNSLINIYRIREACRRIEHQKNITIEGIANSVGFKSVNAFRTSFKKITGLTPSNYIKMSENDKKIEAKS